MSSYAAAQNFLPATGGSRPALPAGRRWDLAYAGILAYLIIEYTRLPAMFEALQGLHLAKIAVAVALLGLLLSARVRSTDAAPRRSVDLALGTFVAAGFFSTLAAGDQANAWETFADLLRWVVVYSLVARIVVSPWRLRIFLLLLMLLNFKLAQFQIRSYVFAKGSGMPEEWLAYGIGAGSNGFFANSNDFGVAMCVAWPLAALLLLGEEKTLTRLFFLLCFGAIVISLLLSGSRGALVAAAVTALVAWARTPKKLTGPLMALVLVLGFLYLLPEASRERARGVMDWERDRNAVARMTLWQAGMRMFQQNPLLGVGPGNFRSSHTIIEDKEIYAANPRGFAPHSIYVQALSELGLLGSVALLVFAALIFRLNARTRRKMVAFRTQRRHVYEYYAALGLDLALVGYLTSGAFLTVLYYPHLWILAGLSVGLNTACTQEKTVAALQGQASSLVTPLPGEESQRHPDSREPFPAGREWTHRPEPAWQPGSKS